MGLLQNIRNLVSGINPFDDDEKRKRQQFQIPQFNTPRLPSFSQIQSRIPQFSFPQSRSVTQPGGQGLAQKAAQTTRNYFNPESNAGQNFWNTNVARGLGRVQQVVSKPPMIKLQQFNKVQNPIGRTAAGLGLGVAENMINIPQRLSLAGTRLGTEYRTGGLSSPGRAIGTAAQIADPLLDIYTLGGASIVKGIGKEAFKQGGRQGINTAFKRGAVEGGGWGAIYGALNGLSEGERASVLSGLQGAAIGAGAGTILGGALGGASGVFGKAFSVIRKGVAKENPTLSPAEINKKALIRTGIYTRDLATGRFAADDTAQIVAGMKGNKLNRNKPFKVNDWRDQVDKELGVDKFDPPQIGLSMKLVNGKKNVAQQPIADMASEGIKNTDNVLQQPIIRLSTKSQKTNPLKIGSSSNQNPSLPNNLSSEGIISQSVEASPKTLAKLKIQSQKLDARQADRDFKEWQEMLYDQTGARTTKGALDDVARLIREATDSSVDKSRKAKFVTSLKTGKPITNKSGQGLERNVLENAKNWKDKPKLSYVRERMDRNIEDIAGKDAPKIIERYIKPVQKAEADRMRWLNKERAEVKNLGIKPKSKESQLLQQFGEKKIKLDILQKELPETWQKVVNAEKTLRSKYDQYLADINKVLTKNGYDPIPKRNDYFLHFQEINNVLERYGIPVKDNTLPTDIAGATADFKPGKNFFTSALPRTGEKTDFDAIQGIDRYLEGASKQIFHTDNIQNLRLFEKALRDRFAGTTHLSNFVSELGEYTNNLAGKKAMIDRASEALVGRKVYGATQRIKQQVGANMVGANIASSLTNYIPLTQAAATTSKPAFAKGLIGATISPLKNDGFVARSDFLTRRFGSDRLYVNAWDNIAEKGGWLFKTIDRFVSETITRGKYHEGISKGLSPAQAMARADNFAGRVIGERSLGSVPTLFTSKTAGFLTQFQLEVNNQLSFMFKDIPRSQGNKLAVASALGQVALYSYLYNNLYENFFGRRPAFDPIGVTQQGIEDYSNPNMENKQATKNLVQNAANQLPFTSVLTGGRIPIGSALPNPFKVLTGESSLSKEITKPLTFLPPTGGGQIKKSIQGLGAFNQGASTSSSDRVRFPIEKTPANLLRSAIGGQWSTKQARDYFREGRSTLGEKQSEIFKNLPDDQKQEYYDNILRSRNTESGMEFVPGSNNPESQGKEGMFSKFFGNEAEATNTELDTVMWVDDSGTTQTVELTTPEKRTVKGDLGSYKEETDAVSNARKIYHADNNQVTREQKLAAYKKLGFEEEDVRYHVRASDFDSDEKAAYIIDKYQDADHDELIEQLAKGRVKSIGGSYFANDGTLDNLYKEGMISYAERKYLKSLKLDKEGNPLAGTGSGGGKGRKPKKITFGALPKPGGTSFREYYKSAKAGRGQQSYKKLTLRDLQAIAKSKKKV